MALNFVIFAVTAIIALAYYYFKRQYQYWDRLGVPYVKPLIPYGSLKGVGTKINSGEMAKRAYNELKHKGPVGGIFFFTAPVALALDLDLLRSVFVKDFQHFHDRGMYVNERDDPLSAHLFSIEGQQWKNLRAKLSPTFTSGKMKMMHPTILQVADRFRDHLRDLSKNTRTEVELKEILAQFTTDVIGNVAFGIECNSMKNPNSEFRRTGKMIFESSPFEIMKGFFVTFFPNAGRALRLAFNKKEVTTFFMKLLQDTVTYREQNQVQRNDFMSLLLQIKNTGRLDGEKADLGTMTFNELAAQVFLFFVAGFETSSSTMTFAFYELAQDEEVQQKAREEVEQVLERHNGEMTYEAALELTYIDQIIQETLRKYPVVDTLFRKVSIPYKVPNTEVILPKGTTMLIPVMGFHRDPEIYPNPDKFDPERFTKENVAARHPYAWMPFGDGPRNCIGLRFGMMQTRLGIATILKDFKVTPSKKTLIPMRFQADGQLLSPDGGMFLNIEPLKCD